MYLSPGAKVYGEFSTASGPGVHADEADSALEDIADRLKEGTLLQLEAEADPGPDGAEERSNPPEDEGWTGEDAIVTTSELMPVSMLVTGQWGPDVPGAFHAMDVRANPPDEARDYEHFFGRMRRCLSEIRRLRAQALERYDRRDRRDRVMVADVERKLEAKLTPARRATLKRQLKDLKAHHDRPWLEQFDRMESAVGFVLGQEKSSRQSILDKPASQKGKPFGLRWSVLAGKGNKKLPFVAYSELPMATCPGAGTCRVPMDTSTRDRLKRRGQAWCYSFKAFRYPKAYARMFFNTLANYADREFAIIRAGGPQAPDGRSREAADRFVEARVRAALRGRGSDGEQMFGRVWMQYVKCLVLAKTRRQRRGSVSAGRPGRVVFMRLFVDGDINTEDNIVEWMEACRQISSGGSDVRGERHVEVYGYTKCWQMFVNVDARLRAVGSSWPDNYTVNLSSGSLYAGGADGSKSAIVRAAMEALPISRGYFEAIDIATFLRELEKATKDRKLRLPVVGQMPFAFSRKRIDDFTTLNRVQTLADLDALYRGEWLDRFPSPAPLRIYVPNEAAKAALLAGRRASPIPVEVAVGKWRIRTVGQQVRRYAFREYLSRLLRDDRAFGALVRDDIARDMNFADEKDYLRAMKARGVKKADVALTGGDQSFTDRMLGDKAIALTLHEVLWTFGLGGSCPLVCGNCSDRADPKDPDGVHRCASKTLYKGRVIHIGLH